MEDSLPIPKTRDLTAAGLVRPYIETLAMVGASTLVGLLVAPRWGTSAVDLLYLPAVLAAAGLHGLWPGLLATIASALAFNFYFTQPIHTFRISSAEDVATVALLFLVTLVTSQLASRLQAQAAAARNSAARNMTIAGLARRLLSCSSDRDIGAVACRDLARLFDCNVVMMTGEPELKRVAESAAGLSLSPSDLAAAAWAVESGMPTGRGTDSVIATDWLFHPIRSEANAVGVLGLARDNGTPPIPADQDDLLQSLIDQVALAVDRARLDRQAQLFAQVREGDRVRSALLASIGQDLEPPLTAIAGALRALKRGAEDEKAQLSAMDSDIAKLQRYLSNLLALGPASDRRPIEAGDVTIDLFQRLVTRGGERVHLSPKEFAVLAELAKHPGRVLTHTHLLRVAWGTAHEKNTEYLRVAVRALRQKLERDPAQPTLIVNEPAVGYRLDRASPIEAPE